MEIYLQGNYFLRFFPTDVGDFTCLAGFFSLMWEILHACRESGRNSVQEGDSLSMRESWKPCCLGLSEIVTLCVIKGCGMGTLFVLVSPCFRENVVVTCKIVLFLSS